MKALQPVTFGLIADVQYAEKPSSGGRYYAMSKPRFQEFITAMNFQSPKPEFVIQLGDLIDGGDNAESELAAITELYSQLEMPHRHVLGNHDFAGIPREKTMNTLAMNNAYYVFDCGGWRFVVLDTQDTAVQGGWPEDSPHYEAARQMLEDLRQRSALNAQLYNGGIGAEQLAWLDTTLTKADYKKMPVVVFGHLPLVPTGQQHTLWNAEQVVAVLQQHKGVKAYFCGHIHHGEMIQQNGIYYVSFEAMVDQANQEGAWYNIRLSSKAIEVEGVGVPDKWTLALTEMIQ